MDLKADRVTLNQLFGTIGEQFQIPPYQRPYAWESEHIDDLWDDLTANLDQGHFLGTIVLNSETDERPQVIDGQQRLTTLLVLLGLIRDEYWKMDSNLVGRIQQIMHADPYASGEAVFRLRTGNANWGVFRDLVLRGPDHEDRLEWKEVKSLPKDVRARNHALIDNSLRLKEKLTEWLEGVESGQRLARLERLEKVLVGKIQLVAIRVKSVADAFLLFETLNDRGLQLSAADLLKNHLLAEIARVSDDETEVKKAAAEWDGLLDDLGPGVDVTRFLRHYLLIQVPKVRKDQVFDHFKKEVARSNPWSLIKELRTYGKLYGEFEDPYRVEDDSVSEVLQDLKTLRASMCYTTLMPARRYLSSDKFVTYARLAEVLTFRYSTIVSMDSKELERVYHRAAKILAKTKGNALIDAKEELVRAMPDSEIFIHSFLQQRMGRHYLVRYTLGKIEETVSDEKEKQLRSGAKVHIEHIMPQTLNDDWREAIGERLEEFPDYVDRWGNLTLLYHSLNQSISNSAFEKKCEEYKNSEVELTRRLCDYSTWNFDVIMERQEQLARIADQIWSVEAVEEGVASAVEGDSLKARISDHLEETELKVLSELSAETSSEEALRLKGRVEAHLDVLLEEGARSSKLDRNLAREIARTLSKLSAESASFDAEERKLFRGAVEYFVLAEDLSPDMTEEGGLEDDARVVAAVCKALGRNTLADELLN